VAFATAAIGIRQWTISILIDKEKMQQEFLSYKQKRVSKITPEYVRVADLHGRFSELSGVWMLIIYRQHFHIVV
jgi:hypothetical protein